MADKTGLVVTSQNQGDAFTITTFIKPRRNGGPNVGAYGAVMSLLATVIPDAYDPEPVAAEQIALADGVTATGAGLVDHATAAALMEYQKRASSGCANGACEPEEMDE